MALQTVAPRCTVGPMLLRSLLLRLRQGAARLCRGHRVLSRGAGRTLSFVYHADSWVLGLQLSRRGSLLRQQHSLDGVLSFS